MTSLTAVCDKNRMVIHVPLQDTFLNYTSARLVHKIDHKQCALLYGCFTPREHAYLAWAFAFAFPVLIIIMYGISVVSSKRRTARDSVDALTKGVVSSVPRAAEGQRWERSSPARTNHSERGPDIYSAVEYHARNVKAVLQMIIGVVAVCVVGWHFFEEPIQSTHQATSLLIDGIGVGLAAAAVLELAYTLFTSGPDEALDPLMLAVAAALLIQIAGLQGAPSPGTATALLLQGLLLAALFATRLMLAERNEDDLDRPNIWWIPKRRDRKR
jgi:hypothetical protein